MGREVSDYRLSDLLDLTILQTMAEAHHRATGIPLGVIDAIDNSILVMAGWQDFCAKFNRASPVLRQRCEESDDYIKSRLVEGEACAYRCKNGLWDIGIPIVVAGRHLATLFMGQFFYEGEPREREFFVQLAHEGGFDVDDYLAAVDRVHAFSHEKIDYIVEYNKGLVGFVADVAEHALLKIEADKKIHESERKFRAIFDQTYQFVGLLSTDGTMLEANKTAVRFIGVEDSDVIGKPFWETAWWAHSRELQGRIRLAVREASKGDFVRFEATIPATDGSLHYVDFSLKPVMDEAGGVVLLIPEGRDITERKRAEEEIRRQAEFLQLMMDAVPFPVFYKDRQGRYLGCNRAFEQFYGMSREQIAGKTAYGIAPKELADTYSRADDDLFAHPGGKTYEGIVQPADGSQRDVVFHKATFEGPDGSLAGLVGVVVDMTDSKRAEKEKQTLQDRLALAQKMESIGRLAGGVAHDFNNMLGVILGNAELALKQVDRTHPLAVNLEEIRSAAEYSADLTRQLLAFARRQTVAPRVLDLNETVDGMLAMLQRLVGEDIDLTWIPCRDLWQVRVDPAQIDQILVNLTANARDSIAGVGKVSIETQNLVADDAYCTTHVGLGPGEYVMLAVRDNGCGMDPETLANVFEPFFTTKERGKGTGLGLATVYGVVKQNDGAISVYSKPGEGASFEICLPRYKSRSAPDLPQAPTTPATGGSETVLLVEDETMVLRLAKTMLAKLGYEVLSAATPGEAIRLAAEHAGEVHLVMTDVIMPEMNGRDLARHLRSVYPNLKQLFMSGYTADVIADQGVLEEGVHFIQKPFSMNDLAAKLREALGQ
jgi:two-component system cell cycle sensor histidine kinase/response regulator CckA